MEKRIYTLNIQFEIYYSRDRDFDELEEISKKLVMEYKTLADLYSFRLDVGSLEGIQNSKLQVTDSYSQQLYLTRHLTRLENIAHFAMLFQAASRLTEASVPDVLKVYQSIDYRVSF